MSHDKRLDKISHSPFDSFSSDKINSYKLISTLDYLISVVVSFHCPFGFSSSVSSNQSFSQQILQLWRKAVNGLVIAGY